MDDLLRLWPWLRNRSNRHLSRAVGEEIGAWVAEKQQPLNTALR